MRDLLEPVRPATGPIEMRAELFRLRSYNPLVRAIWDTANYNGLTVEDKYTLMAYHALRELVETQRELLSAREMSIKPLIIPTTSCPHCGKPIERDHYTKAIPSTYHNGIWCLSAHFNCADPKAKP